MATGPEGFEPPTTWLKARRSTRLTTNPSVPATQHYYNEGKAYKFSETPFKDSPPGPVRGIRKQGPPFNLSGPEKPCAQDWPGIPIEFRERHPGRRGPSVCRHARAPCNPTRRLHAGPALSGEAFPYRRGADQADSGLVRGIFIWLRIWCRRSSWKVMFMFIDLMARAISSPTRARASERL